MAKVIAVGNFKGGVGKTTISANLAFALKEAGKSVLLLDFDQQGQSSQYIGGEEFEPEEGKGAERILEADPELRGQTTASGIDVLHGHLDLGRLDEGGHGIEEVFALRSYIEALPYDYVVIDTPPNMGFRMLGAMAWADYLLIVQKPDAVSTDSTVKLLHVIQGWLNKRWVKPGFRFGIVMNMVDRSSPASRNEAEQARAEHPSLFLPVELTYRRDLINRAYTNRVPVWAVHRMPKDVATAWRTLPVTIGMLATGENA